MVVITCIDMVRLLSRLDQSKRNHIRARDRVQCTLDVACDSALMTTMWNCVHQLSQL